jgi:hypothetical protein
VVAIGDATYAGLLGDAEAKGGSGKKGRDRLHARIASSSAKRQRMKRKEGKKFFSGLSTTVERARWKRGLKRGILAEVLRSLAKQGFNARKYCCSSRYNSPLLLWNMGQQSGFIYVAQDNFSDLIGQLAEARR